MIYLDEPDIIRNINYIRRLSDHKRDILNYYTETPSLNIVYNHPNKSCETIKHIENIFENSPESSKSMIVYRGLDITEFQKINFELKNLVSTSTNSDVSIGFMKKPENFYLLEIRLPPGIKFLAVSLPEFSHPELDEILLPPGGSFEVISEETIKYNYTVPIIKIEEVYNIKKLYLNYKQETEKTECIQLIEGNPLKYLYENIIKYDSKFKPSQFFIKYEEEEEFEEEDQEEIDSNIEEYIKELASQAIDLTHRLILYGYIKEDINFKRVIIKYIKTVLRENIKDYIRTTRRSNLNRSIRTINDVIFELVEKITKMTKPHIDMFENTFYRWNTIGV
jgi:uncharacterized protein YaaR (DUF327 family)